MSIKQIIKQYITIMLHPVVSAHLLSEGTRKFYIGSRLNIKGYKYFHLGTGSTVGKDSRISCISEYSGGVYKPSVNIGSKVYIAYHFTALSAAPITIGENSLFASGVFITSFNHGMNPEDAESYGDTQLEVMPVEIGKGCWVGENVIITPGVTLGDRCIVAAGSVVTKSFPAYSMIGGVPAKILKTYNHQNHEWESTKWNNKENITNT